MRRHSITLVRVLLLIWISLYPRANILLHRKKEGSLFLYFFSLKWAKGGEDPWLRDGFQLVEDGYWESVQCGFRILVLPLNINNINISLLVPLLNFPSKNSKKNHYDVYLCP